MLQRLTYETASRLFSHPNGFLHAEYQENEGSVNWFVKSAESDSKDEGLSVALSPGLGSFRSVIARFGEHYMDNQLYNGFAMRFLRQNGKTFRCLIYTSNMGQSGFWIRIYSAIALNPVDGLQK